MGTLDIILLVLFIPGLVRGFSKGFIEQLAALASILVGGNLALTFSDRLGIWLEQYIHTNHTVLYVLAFIIIVVVTVLGLRILSSLLTNLLKALTINWLNNVLGILFAIVNNAIILGLIVLLIESVMKFVGYQAGLDYFAASSVNQFLHSVLDFFFPLVKDLFQIG